MKNEAPGRDQPLYVFAIGASAGGINAICELVSQIDPQIDAAFLIVVHLSRTGISEFLAVRMRKCTSMPCNIAKDGDVLKKGSIYIGPSNYHLLVDKGKIKLGKGPEENRWRPSIDVLFRSIGVEYNSRSVGIVLTGYLDDGNMGMQSIQKSGGQTIVQDPNEAEYPDMPLAVLNSIDVNFCVPLSEMGGIISKIASNKKPTRFEIPVDVRTEAEIASKVASGIDIVETLGDRSPFSCPDCGGALFLMKDGKLKHYRCHIGHAYGEEDLARHQVEALEGTLWVAVRMMEERRNLLKKFEAQALQRGFKRVALDHEVKGKEMQDHINKLKELIFSSQNGNAD